MRIGRSLIVPAILAFGVASSLLAGPAMSAATAHQASSHVLVVAAPASPLMVYHD
jgi:hypothetical protein